MYFKNVEWLVNIYCDTTGVNMNKRVHWALSWSVSNGRNSPTEKFVFEKRKRRLEAGRLFHLGPPL